MPDIFTTQILVDFLAAQGYSWLRLRRDVILIAPAGEIVLLDDRMVFWGRCLWYIQEHHPVLWKLEKARMTNERLGWLERWRADV